MQINGFHFHITWIRPYIVYSKLCFFFCCISLFQSYCVTIQMRAIELNFDEVLFIWQYKLSLFLKSADVTRVWRYLKNERYRAVFFVSPALFCFVEQRRNDFFCSNFNSDTLGMNNDNNDNIIPIISALVSFT